MQGSIVQRCDDDAQTEKCAVGDSLLAALAAGSTVVSYARSWPTSSSEIHRQLDLFGEVLQRVRSDYVEKPNDAKLIEAAINGMLSALDPHSDYLN